MPETAGTAWHQLKVLARHGTQDYGQSSDGTGDDGNLAAYNADGSLTDSGVAASSILTSGNQNANLVLAGPASGSAAAPTFRSLVADDLPIATSSDFGAVKPDGSTITISGGVISASGGGGGGSVPGAISAGPDWPPGSPGSLDDEFTGGSLGGVWTWVNQGSATATL